MLEGLMNADLKTRVQLAANGWPVAVIALIAGIVILALFGDGPMAVLGMSLLFCGFGGTLLAFVIAGRQTLARLDGLSEKSRSLPLPPAE